ncbi:unnamed protein product [Bathycoccus prasinos]
MSSRIIDYSKWDTLKYSSSSSSEEDDEKARATIAHLGDLLLSSSQRTSSSSPLWNGLVLHHKDVFVSHIGVSFQWWVERVGVCLSMPG